MPVINREIKYVDVRAMFSHTRSNETNADLVNARDKIVAEIEDMLLDILDTDLIDKVKRRRKSVNRREIVVAKFKPSGSRLEAHTIRARDEVRRRFCKAGSCQIGGLQSVDGLVAVEKAEALRDEQAIREAPSVFTFTGRIPIDCIASTTR